MEPVSLISLVEPNVCQPKVNRVVAAVVLPATPDSTSTKNIQTNTLPAQTTSVTPPIPINALSDGSANSPLTTTGTNF